MRELSNIMRGEIKDPRINPMTSVVAVEVAPDLKDMQRLISVCSVTRKHRHDTIKGLQSAEGYIRRALAKNINIRNTPEITFIVDQSIEYGVNISKKIDEVTKDLKDGADDIDDRIKKLFKKGRKKCSHGRTHPPGWRLRRIGNGIISLFKPLIIRIFRQIVYLEKFRRAFLIKGTDEVRSEVD